MICSRWVTAMKVLRMSWTSRSLIRPWRPQATRAAMRNCTRKQRVPHTHTLICSFMCSSYFLYFIQPTEVCPIIFEGFKFTFNKMLSTHFQINHSLTMSSVVPSGYKFGATYLGNRQISPTEVNWSSLLIDQLYLMSSYFSRCFRSFLAI